MNPNGADNSTYWLFWLILAAMFVVLPGYVWHENTSGFLTDDGVYLLMADFFSPRETGNPLVQQLMMDQARFPPAYPVLIGLFGGGAASMQVAHLVTCGTFIASAVLFYLWARQALERKELAAACLVIYALLPRTLVYVLEIWSEFLYMAVVFAALVVLNLAERRRQHSRELLLAGAMLIGLSILTRTIGVALLAAFVVFLYTRGFARKYLYIATAVLLPVCWEVIKRVNHYGGGYGEDLAQYLSWDGAAKLFLTDIPHNAFLLFQSWNRHFAVEPESSWGMHWLSTALLLLALTGLARSAALKNIDFFYVVFYIPIVLVWPYPAHETRFLYPLIPFALVYMFAGLYVLVPGRAARPRWFSQTVLVALTLSMIFPGLVFRVDRFFSPVPGYIPDDYRHTRHWLRSRDPEDAYRESEQKAVVVKAMKRIGSRVNPRQCVYSAHPVSTMLYSQRMSIIVPRNPAIDRLTSCHYLFVMNLETAYRPDYPLHQVDLDRLSLLYVERDRLGHSQAFLFRIHH